MATEYTVKAHGIEQVRSTNRAKMISRADDMLRAAIDGRLAVTITVETVKTGKIVHTAVSAPEIVKGSRVTVDGRTGNVVDIDRIYCEAAVLFDGATDGHEWWRFAEGMELLPADGFDMANLTDAQMAVMETNMGRVPEVIANALAAVAHDSTRAAEHRATYYTPSTTMLRPDVDPAAYSSAVINANDTARENGYARRSDEWFACLDSTYACAKEQNDTDRDRAEFYAAQDAETAALALVPAYEQDAETDTLTVDGIAYAVTVNRSMTHQHSREIMLTAYSTEHPAGFSFRCPRDTADPFNARFYNVANRDGGIDHPTTLTDTIRLIAGRLPSLRTPAAPVDVCPNCTQTHPVEDAELHGAPCFVCASDGHAGCQHGDDAPAALVPDAFDDSTHVIRFVGSDVTLCGELIRGKFTTLRVSVDPSDATCADCITQEASLAARDNAPEPSDDECHAAALLAAVEAAESRMEAAPEYPRTTPDGRTVWACCESTIGAPCEHRTGARSAYGPMVVIEPCRTDGRKAVAWLLGLGTTLRREFRTDRTTRLHVAYWAQTHGVRPKSGKRFQWQEHETLSLAPARV